MSRSFDPIAYVMRVGQELVSAFQMAGPTTPGQIGSARDSGGDGQTDAVAPQRSTGVGSGHTIDSFGNTSRQMDVVLYEKEICPVFAINEDPASTYYPCEGVIAVGEVKSSLDSSELEDLLSRKSRASRNCGGLHGCRLCRVVLQEWKTILLSASMVP